MQLRASGEVLLGKCYKLNHARQRLFLASGVAFPLLAPPTAEETKTEKAIATAGDRAVYGYEPIARRVFRGAEVKDLPVAQSAGSFPSSHVAPDAVR
jgi:hypothetical protein